MSSPAAQPRASQLVRAPARTSPTNQARPSREVDHPDLAQRGGEAAIVAELLGELDRAAEGLLGAVEVDLDRRRRRTTRRAALRRSAWPSSRVARSSIARVARLAARARRVARAPPPRPRRGSSGAPTRAGAGRRARAPGRASPRRGRPSSARPSSRSPSRRRTANASSRVARRTRRSAGDGHDRQRLLDEPERLLGRVRARGPPPRHRSRSAPRASVSPAASACWASIGRPAGGGSPPSSSRSTTARMDLASPGVRELRRGEVADLLVGERVVGGVALRDAGAAGPPSTGRARARSCDAHRRSAPRRPIRAPGSPARSRRLKLRPRTPASPSSASASRREARGAAIDERPHRGRHEPRRVPAEPPLAVDLLQRAGLAMRPGELLDDERHALGLGVHRRDGLRPRPARRGPASAAPRLDRAEAAPGRRRRTRPIRSMSATKFDGLGDRGELVRPDRSGTGRPAGRRRCGRRSGGGGGCRRRPTGRRR